MNRLSGAGLAAMIFGFALIILKALSKISEKPFDFADISINIFIYPDGLPVTNSISPGFFHSFFSPVMNAPLYLICIIVGLILLIIGGIYDK
jgi:flagellar biosynthesis protein FliQ